MKREYTVNIVKDNIIDLQDIIEEEEGYTARQYIIDCLRNADDCWNDAIKNADFVEIRYNGLFEEDDWSDTISVYEFVNMQKYQVIAIYENGSSKWIGEHCA